VPDLVNLRFLAHPINWLFVWVTLLIAALAFHAVQNSVNADVSQVLTPS
jgi:hypothetical protein